MAQDPRLDGYTKQIRAEALQIRSLAAQLRVDLKAVVELLRREQYGARSTDRARELPDSGQVGIRVDAFESADAKRRERPINLQASELALDCGAMLAELAEARRLARDQRVEAGRA